MGSEGWRRTEPDHRRDPIGDVTLAYEPGETIVHRLDPRSKLAVQVAFAAAAFAHTTPRGLAALTALGLLLLAAARLSVLETLFEVRFVLVLVVAPVVIEGLTWEPPWFSIADVREPALASYRVLLILLVSAAYVRTTPVRESEAAIRWLVPGRVGRALALGVGLVFRFLPVLQADLTTVRGAMRARLGDERPLTERMWIVATAGLDRAFGRADRLALAMGARCLSWNPTMPALRFERVDLPGLALAAALLVWAVL